MSGKTGGHGLAFEVRKDDASREYSCEANLIITITRFAENFGFSGPLVVDNYFTQEPSMEKRIVPKIVLIAVALTLFSGYAPASAFDTIDFVEDFSAFSNAISSFQSGGDQQQVISTSVGTAEAGVPAIDGTSVFLTIDTTNTPPTGSGSYGGGLRTDITNAFDAGDLTSSNPEDYDIIFDVAANGFAPNNLDLFLQFRNSTNDNVLPSQLGINQNNAALAPFLAQLGNTDGTVSVSIGLENFSPVPADVSALINSDRIQFQFFTRSIDSNYSDDAGNVLVLDNVGVRFTAAVPEPTSAALLVIGSLGLIARRRRKR